MKRTPLLVAFIVLASAAVSATWWLVGRDSPRRELVLYGDVDLRQVELAFNNNERIAAVLVQEGDRVKRGQILARVETSRLEPQLAQAEATTAARREAVERLRNGSRPQEITEARANVESARADAINAREQYERRKTLAANSIAQGSTRAGRPFCPARITMHRVRVCCELRSDTSFLRSVRSRPQRSII
jgi:HlyD family secretion protein